MASGSVVLRLPGDAVEHPVAFDCERQLSTFLEGRLPTKDYLFCRSVSPNRVNPLSCDNSREILTPPYPALPTIEIGELQWPTGASRYGRALYAVDSKTMAAVAKSCWGWTLPAEDAPNPPVPDNWGPNQKKLTLSIQGNQLFTAKMYPLAPFRVGGAGMGINTGFQSLWLLPLVDARYYYRGLHESTTTAPETIEDYLSTLADEMSKGLTIQVDPIDTDYGTKIDKRLYETLVPTPASCLLDIAALSYGLRVVFDPSTEKLRALGIINSTKRRKVTTRGWETNPDELDVLASGVVGQQAGLEPAIAVYVKQGESYVHKKGTLSSGDSFSEIGQQSGDRGPNPQYPIYTTWQLTDSNATETTAFVNQLASDLNGWSNSGSQYSILGSLMYLPSGFDDFLSIQVFEHDLNNDGILDPVMRSRVFELPSMFGPWVYLVGGELEECGGSSIRYFVLAEDASACPVWAYRASMSGSGIITATSELFQLYFHSQLLSLPKVARAGYKGMYGLDDEGRDSFIGNPCIVSCTTAATVDPSSLPDSTVGAAYSGTVTVSGLNAAGVTAANLPSGLTINATTGAITGTSATAGEYIVLFSGSDSSGCTVTVAKKIVINEA